MNKHKNAIVITLVLFFLLFIRFFKINEIPTAFVHDELIYVMQAKAISFTGHDMSGTWSPSSLKPFNTAFAELPSSLMTIGINLSSNPVISGRITHILVGILLPFALAWFTYGIWKNKQLAGITLVIGSVNPWIWQFSRMTFDSLFSLFFYLLGGAIILNSKKWWKLLSVPILFVGFFQYQGMKLLFIPWVVLLVAYEVLGSKFELNKKFLLSKLRSFSAPLIIIIISSLALFGYYIQVALPQQSASTRMSQIVFFEKAYTAAIVDKDRQLSIISPFLPLVSNKYTVMMETVVKNTFGAINPTFLFFAADEAANRFAATNHGYFYLPDFFLICGGIFFLIVDKKKFVSNIYYLVIVVTTLIPAVITTS
jgi:hypothetical protein